MAYHTDNESDTTTQATVGEAAPSAGLSPESADVSIPIVSDSSLEKTINLGSYNYYIGMLKDSYLPVRVAPYEEGLALGWSDPDYSLDEMEVAIGHQIEVVEVVESETGTWAGFLSDGEILYTDVAYVRIRDGEICPPISKKFLRPSDPISLTYVPEGSREVSPKDNQNWLGITPYDVRLAYYNFNQHNDEVVSGDYTVDGINSNPTLRCSEGYYYFILADNKRRSEAVTSGEVYGEYKSEAQIEADKQEESSNSIDSLKNGAFERLLEYLGKKGDPNKDGSITKMLKDEHFVLSGLKVSARNTTVDPNNQKALFAIRASYVDALPDKTFSEIYDSPSMAPYKSGKNYSFTIKLNEIPKICEDLVSKFKTIKSKLESSRLKVLDVSDLEYDINIQIEQLERFPKELDGFLKRQAFPALTDYSDFASIIAEGTGTQHDHIIQIALADNNVVGCGVRETVSYVLFSPDPKSLLDVPFMGNTLLFDFDPFITEEELSNISGTKRSAVHLKAALPYIREVYDGAYGSRTLHLIMAHSSITKFLNTIGGDLSSYDWAEFLQKYCVPPLKIYPSKDPQQFTSVEDLDCEELIQKLNNSGPNVGRQEKLLQEQLYNNPRCREMYFEQFKDATHAGDPSLSTKGLEETREDMRQASAGSSGEAGNKYISIIFDQFFHVLDPMALMSLIMACLQKKLGIALSIEAICEAAIVELVKTVGTETMTKLLITAAYATPQSEVSQRILTTLGDPNSPYYNPEATQDITTSASGTDDPYGADRPLKLDERYDGAPIATALVVGKVEIPYSAIEVIRNMEKAGIAIQLKPAPRQLSDSSAYTKPIDPSEKATSLDPYVQEMPAFIPGNLHTEKEIDSELERLLELGYTSSESQALLVQSGYMIPDSEQWGLFASHPNSFKDAPRRLNYQAALKEIKQSSDYDPGVNGPEVIRDAKAWLAYIKANVVDLGTLCELLVGDVLDGLEFLMKDPHAFLGGFGDWWEDFMDALKRAFSFNLPSLNFPENLSTDSHMGNYGEKLLEALLTMVAMIFGEIAQLLIKEALEKCLEENSDQGPAMNPTSPRRPASETIPNIRTADIPKISGMTDEEVVRWLIDIIDNLTTGQLCALLRGDATKKTLYACLSRTEINWPQVYSAGIDTIYEIRVTFEKLGRSLPDLDICNVLTASSPVVTSVCEAIYNSDARCEELQKAGLTKEECDKHIQDELNDLKNKLIDLAGLGMFGMSPSASGQYGLPSPCAAGGFFELPPGVKDSMERITDNLLTAVKSSLIQDMSSLEFFSVPPRAIMAATDPEEMKRAHNLFSNVVRNPYYKVCFAYIGNPWNHTSFSPPQANEDGVYNHGRMGSHNNSNAFKWYPLTYNKYMHYGALTTEGWGVDWRLTDNTVKTRKEFRNKNKQDAIKFINKAQEGEGLGTLTKNPFHYGWDARDDLTWTENFLENALHFEPMHYGMLLKNSKISHAKGWTKNEIHEAKWEFIQDRYDDRESFKSILNKLRVKYGGAPWPEFNQGNYDQNVGSKINTEIVEMFKEPVKPIWLREMVIDVEDFQDMNYNPIGPLPTSWPEGTMAFDIASPDINPIGLPLFEIDSAKGPPTPSGGCKWVGMLRNFTGYDLNEEDTWFFGGVADEAFGLTKAHFTSGKWPVLDTSKGDEGFSSSDTSAEGQPHWWAKQQVPEKIRKGLKVSPGLCKLWKIFKQLADPEYEPPQMPDPTNEPIDPTDTIDATETLDPDSTIINTFMQLQLWEALGLDAERCGTIFGSFGPVTPESIEGVILSFGRDRTRVVSAPELSTDQTKNGTTVTTTSWTTNQPGNLRNIDSDYTFFPQYIVFRQYFADPESPLSFDKEKMIDFFSSDKDLVNRELHRSLSSEGNFHQILGFDNRPSKFADMPFKGTYGGGPLMSNALHHDPDIIKIRTSFTELSSKKIAGFDGSKITDRILNKLRTREGASEIYDSLLGQLEFVNKKENLIYQNVGLPLESNIHSQLVDFRDIFKFVKGKLKTDAGDWSGTLFGKPIIGSEEELGKEKYNFNFGKKLDPDVQGLIKDLYKNDPGKTLAEKIIGDKTTNIGYEGNYSYNPLNFKAQVFAKLLSHRFIDMYNDYKPEEAITISKVANTERALRHQLAHMAFPALQMAYVHQSFAKLKHSRLHERGMMKKLWKKILKNPINSSAIDPRCLDAAAGYTAASREDLENTETDFFNLGDVKQRILAFYEKSICHDVYEKSSPEDNAARIALLQGCVILLVKIYTLEVCLASLIAWDSYDISDVAKGDILTKIIIKNIKEDINVDMIAHIANDILKKEEGLSEVQMAEQRGVQSGLEYLVKAEGKYVTQTIKGMFINSTPMTTDLNLEVLRASNVDADSLAKKIWFDDDPNKQQISASIAAAQMATFYDQTGHDFVIDARFGSNVFTMNYGDGSKQRAPIHDIDDTAAPSAAGTFVNTDLSSIDLFDKKEWSTHDTIRHKNNKSFFHSLPMSHRTDGHLYRATSQGFILNPKVPGTYAMPTPTPIQGGADIVTHTKEELFADYTNHPFFDSDSLRWSEFKVLNNRRRKILKNGSALTKENFIENTAGTDLNRVLGNIIFQPYVKITHILESEKDDYWSSMSTRHSYEVEGSDTDAYGEPCEPDYVYSSEFSANHPHIREALDDILSTFDEDKNVFKCFMLGFNGMPAYIPISAWSHFYNTIFLRKIETFSSSDFPDFNPLKELYNKYGFRLICKDYKIGLRMTYSIPTDTFDHQQFNDVHHIRNIINNAFTGDQEIKGLKACKSLYVQRPYLNLRDQLAILDDLQTAGSNRILTEMHIPIVEVEKSIIVQEGTGGFTLEDDSRLFSLEEMGFWAENIGSIAWDASLQELSTLEEEKLKFLTKAPYSFFYKNLAQDLVTDLKNSAEFKLIFDHCLPLRRYMTLGFIYAADGLSKFVTEPTDVLDETKKTILMIIQNIMNSQDYKYVHSDVSMALADISLRNMGGTTGKEPDMTKLILKIIYKTLFLILKGFVEITDPAVIIAKLIIDVANAVVTATLSLIEQGLTMAKQVQQGVKITADTALQTALMQLKVAAGMVKSISSTLPGVGGFITINTDNIDENYVPSDEVILGIDGVGEDGEIEEGSQFKIVYDGLDANDQQTVDRFIESFLQVNSLFEIFVEAKEFLDDANNLLNEATEALATFQTDAQETMQDLFQSPFLLPGLWAAMLPSMIPYGGGIIPFPFFAGPPSTIPGMIYIALLLIDAIEEKQHNDIFGEDDCEDQL